MHDNIEAGCLQFVADPGLYLQLLTSRLLSCAVLLVQILMRLLSLLTKMPESQRADPNLMYSFNVLAARTLVGASELLYVLHQHHTSFMAHKVQSVRTCF